jgi:sterol desaturase/sphingolipid hydroxylase (fatty acid hydroxylase superfamily)
MVADLDLGSVLRIAAFLGVFVAVASWEAARPRRPRAWSRRSRWPHNLGLLALDALILRLLMPAGALGATVAASAHGWGLLRWLDLPVQLAIPVAVILLDLTIYLQHVAFHKLAPLWRLHRVHHADMDFDVTTGTRFHPLEILISAAIKIATVVALGASPLAVLVFEIVLNAMAMFNHANASLPPRAETALRRIVVTPDMHRIHHSVRSAETNSNFGFNLPWWDHLFGTYRPAPAAGHDRMLVGVQGLRSRADVRIDRLLLQPFRSRPAAYPIPPAQEVE